jgi:hypothetical protein
MKNVVFWDVTPCVSVVSTDVTVEEKIFFAVCVGCYLRLTLFLVHRFLSP